MDNSSGELSGSVGSGAVLLVVDVPRSESALSPSVGPFD